MEIFKRTNYFVSTCKTMFVGVLTLNKENKYVVNKF